MSRTWHSNRKKRRGFGKEYWSARPGNYCGGGTGKKAKKITHCVERRRGKNEMKKEIEED